MLIAYNACHARCARRSHCACLWYGRAIGRHYGAIRSNFQFDQKFLWLFVGRDASRMRFLFESYRRPPYGAAGDITQDPAALFQFRIMYSGDNAKAADVWTSKP